MDYCRRMQGNLLDLAGLGPIESPSRAAWTEFGFTLRAYAGTVAGPAVLVIPAPIKRAYIWDLAPATSAVRQLLRCGPVYLIDWDRPQKEHEELGLADYADRLILGCLRAIREETGRQRVFLAGHSLGGTLAAIFAALNPECVQGLILLESPLHFGPKVSAFGPLVAAAPPVSCFVAKGNVPGTFLDLVSNMAAPGTFQSARWLDWWASLSNPQAALTHLRVERWTLDESPLPRRLFEEIVEWLYREDRFLRGTLQVGDRPADPRRLTAPVLSVVSRHSSVVPPQCVAPFHEAITSSDRTILWYEGDIGVAIQHAGSLVGEGAHRRLWPAIVRWIEDRA
jgi:polyhydroxyalkanoate synthase